jgi:hypothetical protein
VAGCFELQLLITPVGKLFLISDEQVLLAAGFKSLNDLIKRLSDEDSIRRR